MALKDAANDVDNAITRVGYKGMSFENAFGGALSFMRRRYSKDLEGVDLAVTGVPFDQAVTNRPGTRLGPRAIREASTLQPCDPPYGWDINPLAISIYVTMGIWPLTTPISLPFPQLFRRIFLVFWLRGQGF